MFEIIEGPQAKPQRVLVYGPEGIGKSTLASLAPDPIFVDVEDGTGQLEAKRLPVPRDWGEMLAEIAYLADNELGASTIVVDTVDAAERLCAEHVCRKNGKPSIESWGYGKGYVILREEFEHLLQDLDRARAHGYNVVLVAHSCMRKFERPDESGAYDRFELKLNQKHTAPLVKEWADAVLFCDYETFVTQDENGKAKASGGRRVVHCDHSPVWDAKNRWGLPSTVGIDADGIAQIMGNLPVRGQQAPAAPAAPAAPTVQSRDEMTTGDMKTNAERLKGLGRRFSKVKKLMVDDHVSIAELEGVMVAKGKRQQGEPLESWETAFLDWLVGQWPSVLALVKENRDIKKVAAAVDVPF
jgi:hypothetical protein